MQTLTFNTQKASFLFSYHHPLCTNFWAALSCSSLYSFEMKWQREKLEKANLGSPHKRPCFYKIIWFANSINLRIPLAFKHHFSNQETHTATLKTPSGSWDVKLVRKKGDIYFGQGWQEFLKHHSLGHAELLVFKYNGHMSFDVVICDKSGCEINYRRNRTFNQEPDSCFTSSFPFFRHVMKNYNIGTSGTLVIPKAFQKKHLPLSKQQIILRDSKGIYWPVSITVTSCNVLSMCGGWKDLADYNSIKKGDVCIFELVEQNKMQVHIFRHN